MKSTESLLGFPKIYMRLRESYKATLPRVSPSCIIDAFANLSVELPKLVHTPAKTMISGYINLLGAPTSLNDNLVANYDLLNNFHNKQGRSFYETNDALKQ